MNKVLNKSGELEYIITKISSKNQITLPVKVIKKLGFQNNQRVKVLISKNGKLQIEMLPDPIAKLRGILKGTNLGVKDFLRERYVSSMLRRRHGS